MPQDTSDTRWIDTMETLPEQLPPTTEDLHGVMGEVITLPKSLTSISEEQKIAEKAMEDAFPIDGINIEDVSVEDFVVHIYPSGLKFLDEHLVFIKNTPQLVVVGAHSGHGKSAFMGQMSIALGHHTNVAFFSLEMKRKALKRRMMSLLTQEPLSKFINNQIPVSRLKEANKLFSEIKLTIWDNFNSDINYICQQAYSFSRTRKVGLVVIDYLQLITGEKQDNRTYEIKNYMKKLKDLSEQLKCNILIGSQLNSKCIERGNAIRIKDGRGDYRPIALDEMAESMYIGRTSDVALFLSRHELFDKEQRQGEIDVILAKNRDGTIKSKVHNFYGKFCEIKDKL